MSLKSERIYNTMMLTGAGAPGEVKAKDLPNLLEKPDSSIKKKKKSPAPKKVLMCVHEDVNDLAKEVSLGMYSNNGIVEELVKLSQRIDTMRGEP